jgi:hypothetical protein
VALVRDFFRFFRKRSEVSEVARYLELALAALANDHAPLPPDYGESGRSGESTELTWRELGLCANCGGEPAHLSLVAPAAAYCVRCSPRRSVRVPHDDERCDLCAALIYRFSTNGAAQCLRHAAATARD